MAELKSGVPLVRALDRGLALLQVFTPARPRQTLTEVAKGADLDKGTARRLLQTLTINGFVGYNELTSHYFLTTKLLEIGAAVETGRDLRDVGASYLRDIADRTGAAAFLWVHSDGMALCVDRAKAIMPNVDATWFMVGAQTTMNSGGGPRVLLAFISEAERRIALAKPLVKRTPASETDPAALARQVEQIRAKGWDFAIDDFVVGLAGLGVPIFDADKRLAGALSIATLTAAFEDPHKPIHLDLIRTAAAAIGSQMSGRR
jgi:DNA-binding IclR family transcriptional regulator